MTDQNSNQNIFPSMTSADMAVTTLSDNMHSNQNIDQNFLLIWLDESKQEHQSTLASLQSVINDVIIFTKPNECVDFLHKVNNTKASC
jgi:hypothetical protein